MNHRESFPEKISRTDWKIWFWLAFAVFIVGGTTTIFQVSSLAKLIGKVDHTYEVQKKIGNVLLQVSELESLQYSFFIRNEITFIGGYDNARTNLLNGLESLEKMTADNPSQNEKAHELCRLVESRIFFMDSVIKEFREGKMQEAAGLLKSDVPPDLTRKIQDVAEKMDDKEGEIFISRSQRVSDVRHTLLVVVSSMVAVTTLLTLTALLLRRQSERTRKELQTELEKREKSDRSAQERELQLKTITDSMPQFVWSCNPDGEQDFYNEQWFHYTGMPRDTQPPNLKCTPYLHPDDIKSSADAWARSISLGVPYENEYRFRRAKDGIYRWFIGRALPIRDKNGTIIKWFGTSTDIDDQKRFLHDREFLLESERAARGEAERALRLKDEFLATLSHELRTPLNSILGWTQLMRRRGVRAEVIEEGLSIIERNARVQSQLIEDLLDMSRIISGKLKLTIEHINLSLVVDGSISTSKPAADAKGITFSAILDPSVKAILGDYSRLQQILWNLLSNAVKFTPKGGQVSVVTRQEGSFICLEVSDNGQGIEQEFLPFVFDKFRQADGTVTRKSGGLGLGLSIVKQLVELHGATIRVHSEGRGKGTTFLVNFPIHIAVPRVNASTLGEEAMSTHFSAKLKGLRVLVVDDDADARAFMERLLREYEVEVTVVTSALEVLHHLESSEFDVLLSDVSMPDMDGYTLIRHIRALKGTAKNIPAAALTALTRSEDRTRALLAGFQSHVGKPVEPVELVAVIASLVSHTLIETSDFDGLVIGE